MVNRAGAPLLAKGPWAAGFTWTQHSADHQYKGHGHTTFNNVKASEAIKMVPFMTRSIWLGGGGAISAFLNWLGHHAGEESSDSPARFTSLASWGAEAVNSNTTCMNF